jgi:hypothetical protein
MDTTILLVYSTLSHAAGHAAFAVAVALAAVAAIHVLKASVTA